MKNIEFYYAKDTRGQDFSIAHLYEHIFIAEFLKQISQLGFYTGLWGWISGETFYNGALIISCGFYDKRAAKKFKTFINKKLTITEDIFNQQISVVEAEDKVNLDFNKNQVLAELKKIDAVGFLDMQNDNFLKQFEPISREPKSPIFKRSNNPRAFETFTIGIACKSQNPKDEIIFLRLTPIISNKLDRLITENQAFKQNHFDLSRSKYGKLIMGVEFIIRKNQSSTEKIKKLTEKILNDKKILYQKSNLKKYIAQFAAKDNFSHLTEHYFKATGILTSRKTIAKNFTPKNIYKILKNIEVIVTKSK
jgi:hypothetical protein